MQASPDSAQWRRIVAEFEASGESARAFAESRGLTASALGYWRRRLARAPTVPSSSLAVSFVEVKPDLAPSTRYEIALCNGRSVWVGGHFDDVVLARLLLTSGSQGFRPRTGYPSSGCVPAAPDSVSPIW